MGIINKQNIKKALENPLGFVVIILLIILALSQSFALWCFIGGILGIIPAIFGKNPNSLITFFCNDSSWKIKLTNSLSALLSEQILIIILLSLIAWALLKYTEKGQEILSLLD